MRCLVQGKTCHKTKSDAIKHLNSLERRKRRQKGEIYKCRYCQQFHITSSVNKFVTLYKEKKRKLLHEWKE